MKKRIVSAGVIFVLGVFVLTGCGREKVEEKNRKSGKVSFHVSTSAIFAPADDKDAGEKPVGFEVDIMFEWK